MDLIANEPYCEPTKICDSSNSIPDRLLSKKRALEKELAETNAAIEAMQKNPEVATVLTLVAKALGRY